MTNPYPITPRQLNLVDLSGSHLTEQGVYPDIKMGVVASYNVSNVSAETVLKSTASGGLTLGSLNVQGNSTLRNVLPESPDTYDLGSSINLWRKGWLSELDTILFAQNTAALVGGWLIIGKDQGSIPSFVDSTDTTIDFGKTMIVGGSVVFRSSLQVEYIGIGSLASGSTVYNAVRNLDGSGANDWVEGSVFLALGESGDGRIELNAYDTPRIQMIQQGATYNQQKEIIRIGDLNGNWNYSSEEWGVAIGSYGSGSANITVDSNNGVRINVYDTPIMEFKSTGAFISNVLNMTGGDAAIAIGATPPTAKDAGTGLWLSKDGLFSLASNVYQVKIDATDGSLYAGGGDIVLNANGLIFYGDIDWYDENSIFWRTRISTTYDLYGQLSFKIPDEHGVNGTLTVLNNNITTNDEAIIRLYSETKSHWAEVYLDNRYNNYSSLSLSVSTKFDRTELKLENTRVTLDVGNGSASTRVLYITDTYLRYYGKLRAYRNTTDYTGYIFVPLTTPLTSTSWDGDSFSTTAKTLIDLSAVFGVPDGVKAVMVTVAVRDSASQTSDTVLTLSPNNTAGVGIRFSPQYVNDRYGRTSGIVPCNANGDIYYQIDASGAGTFDVVLQIWSYWI